MTVLCLQLSQYMLAMEVKWISILFLSYFVVVAVNTDFHNAKFNTELKRTKKTDPTFRTFCFVFFLFGCVFFCVFFFCWKPNRFCEKRHYSKITMNVRPCMFIILKTKDYCLVIFYAKLWPRYCKNKGINWDLDLVRKKTMRSQNVGWIYSYFSFSREDIWIDFHSTIWNWWNSDLWSFVLKLIRKVMVSDKTNHIHIRISIEQQKRNGQIEQHRKWTLCLA